ASCNGDLRRGTNANATAAASTSTSHTRCRRCRSGNPRAWYCRQSKVENGESRLTCHDSVRSQNTRTAWSTFGSSSSTKNDATVATTKPAANAPSRRRVTRTPSGYVAQSGTTRSAANFDQLASAENIPRAHDEVSNKKPQIRNAGRIVSFVLELDTYCVNGDAAHEKASDAPSSGPPSRSPTRPSPTRPTRSKPIYVACAAH